MPLAGVRWPVFIPMGGNGWFFNPWQDHGVVDLKVHVWFSITLCLSAFFFCLEMYFLKKLPSACWVWYFCLLNFYGVQRGELPHLSYPWVFRFVKEQINTLGNLWSIHRDA